MANCPSCGFQVELNWKVCPSCTNPLVFPSSINHHNVSASDSIIQGDQFSGTKAETIIINQYGNGAGNNVPTDDSSTNSKVIENTPTPIVGDQPLKKCSRCKLELTDSLQPINCVEPDCEKSMCSSCYGLWRVPQMNSWQYCQQHTESHRKEYELQCQNCSNCNTVIGYGIEHGICEIPECNHTMCMTCYKTWFVADPMHTYRADSGPWNYCKSHTQQAIDKANQQLDARFQILNDTLDQSLPKASKISVQERLRMSYTLQSSSRICFVGSLILGILLYPGKLFVTSKISGWFYALYTIFCFWLMIPTVFLALIGCYSGYNDSKKDIHNYKIRLNSPFVFQQFRLTSGSKFPFWSSFSLVDYDPATKSVTGSIFAGTMSEREQDYDLSYIIEMIASNDYNLETRTNSANE